MEKIIAQISEMILAQRLNNGNALYYRSAMNRIEHDDESLCMTIKFAHLNPPQMGDDALNEEWNNFMDIDSALICDLKEQEFADWDMEIAEIGNIINYWRGTQWIKIICSDNCLYLIAFDNGQY